MTPTETFVFEGVEVVKTGREAIREVKTVTGQASRKMTLVEIKPLDPDAPEWKKWVDPAHLFVVQSRS
jgi:hypothetical protein